MRKDNCNFLVSDLGTVGRCVILSIDVRMLSRCSQLEACRLLLHSEEWMEIVRIAIVTAKGNDEALQFANSLLYRGENQLLSKPGVLPNC